MRIGTVIYLSTGCYLMPRRLFIIMPGLAEHDCRKEAFALRTVIRAG